MFQIAKENLRDLESASVPPLSDDEPLGPNPESSDQISDLAWFVTVNSVNLLIICYIVYYSLLYSLTV